jgi:hypothetical protein
MMLVDCCVLCCRGCGPIAAVWQQRPPWSIKFDRILPSFLSTTHVTSPPIPSPTTNQPPIRPNISTNIWQMRTFQVTILCACMVGRRLCCMVAHIYCCGVSGSWWSSKTQKKTDILRLHISRWSVARQIPGWLGSPGYQIDPHNIPDTMHCLLLLIWLI